MKIATRIIALAVVCCCLLSCKQRTPTAQQPSAEPATAQDAIQAMHDRLQTSIVEHRSSQPASEDVEATIAFGKQQQARFPDDADLNQALAAMMFQSLPLVQDDPPKLMQRRLEVGAVVRRLINHPEVLSQVQDTLSVLLLEESKGFLQKQDIPASWQSIQDSRNLGFQQPKLLYLDPAFEPILQNPTYASEIQSWLVQVIDREIAQQEHFPLSLKLTPLDNTDPAEQVISLEHFQNKKLILLDLWGTWCPPCRAAVPHLAKIQQDFSESVAVVGMNFEQPLGTATFQDTKARYDEFRKSQAVNYLCVYGDFDPRTSIPGFQGFPTMILLDAQGRVRLMLTGYHPPAVLETCVRRVLESIP